MKDIQKLTKLSNEQTDLFNIIVLLNWDQETYMPDKASKDRSYQIQTLTTLLHKKQTSKSLGKLIEKLLDPKMNLSTEQKALVRVMKRDYDKETKLPTSFVSKYSKLTSESLGVWTEARKKSDFSIFAPKLEKIVDMMKQMADYFGYSDHPYDALIDLYEEGMTSKQITKTFEDIKGPIKNILKQTKYKDYKELELNSKLDLAKQEKFSKEILGMIGFNFDSGREDVSTHPFTEKMGSFDIRLTNRYNDGINFIFSALHEGGHGLYEQGVSKSFPRTLLANGVSLGIHESQSRLWENQIGRSKEFWSYVYPKLNKSQGSVLDNINLNDFMQSINAVKPGFIRVDADEVTYNFHIIIRYEIELGLIDGSIKVKDLREIWNAKYKDYLGIDVKNDAQGVLQDIHWSMGGIGYFPTYTLGNLNAAQIWNTYKKYDPNYQQTISTGNFKKILDWLYENIHKHGSVYQPQELMKRVTGEETNPKYFIKYLEEKYLCSEQSKN